MLDLKFIRENPERVRKAIESKAIPADLDRLLALDLQRRKLLQEVETLKSERNRANEEITRLKSRGESVEKILSSMKSISQNIDKIDDKVGEINESIHSICVSIPNIPHESVPVSKDASGNRIVREGGEKRAFRFKALDHLELGRRLGWLSFERGAKVTGAAFPVFQGKGARVVRVLIQWMLDLHTKEHGYEEVSVPHLVNRTSMFGTGQLPRLEDDMYRLRDDDYFLIPTAEVPVTNLHRDETFSEKDLPRKYVCYTPCYRREAGSYGKETKGLARVHQFDKVELVKFVKPETGLEELEGLVKDAERVLHLLEIPYRVVLLCTAELSFAGAKGYDLEVWAPVTGRWFEVSSCSWFSDFQARRMNIRYLPAARPARGAPTGDQEGGHHGEKGERKQNGEAGQMGAGEQGRRFGQKGGGKPQLVHTLNGSGVALARTLLCLLENFQTASGDVEFPKVLRPYLD